MSYPLPLTYPGTHKIRVLNFVTETGGFRASRFGFTAILRNNADPRHEFKYTMAVDAGPPTHQKSQHFADDPLDLVERANALYFLNLSSILIPVE